MTHRTPPRPRTHPQRRRLLRAAGLAPLAWLAPLAARAAASDPDRPADPAAVQAAVQTLQALLAQRLRHQGVALAVARIDGARSASALAGSRAAGGTAPPTEADRFEIGSVGKTLVALLLARQVLARELALDDPVEAALPAGLRLRDSQGAPLRWVDLATHRSGLPRLPDNLRPRDAADPYEGYDEAALWDFLQRWRPQRPRDAAFEYSNLGFGLLGQALALRAGSDFEALLRREVLQPLGLDGLTVARKGRADPLLLPGHDAARRPVPPWHFGVLAGAGGWRASLADMRRYAECAAGAVEHPLGEAMALTMAPRADGPAPGTRIGLAWFVTPFRGRSLVHHDGGTFGFASSLFVEPAARRAAVVLANAAVPLDDLARHLLDPALPLRDFEAEAQAAQAAAQAPVLALPAEALAPLAGVYALNPQFKVTVTADGTRLFAQATGQGAFELFAQGPRRFFARVTPLQILFEGEAGVPPAFELQQGGQRLRFVREPAP